MGIIKHFPYYKRNGIFQFTSLFEMTVNTSRRRTSLSWLARRLLLARLAGRGVEESGPEAEQGGTDKRLNTRWDSSLFSPTHQSGSLLNEIACNVAYTWYFHIVCCIINIRLSVSLSHIDSIVRWEWDFISGNKLQMTIKSAWKTKKKKYQILNK